MPEFGFFQIALHVLNFVLLAGFITLCVLAFRFFLKKSRTN